ncbi:hypothetical protein ACFX12_014251 [Malus domestica]
MSIHSLTKCISFLLIWSTDFFIISSLALTSSTVVGTKAISFPFKLVNWDTRSITVIPYKFPALVKTKGPVYLTLTLEVNEPEMA